MDVNVLLLVKLFEVLEFTLKKIKRLPRILAVQSSTQTDGMLQRISAAVEEQTKTMQEINNSVSNLEKIAHTNSSASEELAASMIELSKVADSTRREIDKFKI